MADLNPEQALDYLRWNRLGNCTRCGLCRKRSMLVFGEGSPEADLMFIGGTPDAAEDKQGKPFVGASGNMLTWSIERIGLSRPQVYVTNIVKCRPPDARDPSPDEIATCAPFLHAQIWLVRPKVIVTLGRLAGNLLTGQEDVSLSKLRQGDWSYRNAKTNLTVPVVPTHHPSYVLRKRGSAVERHTKNTVISDLRKALRLSEEIV